MKKIINSNKAVLALSLVLFFVASGFLKARSLHIDFPKATVEHTKKAKHLLSVATDNSGSTLFEKFPDNTDSDDPGLAIIEGNGFSLSANPFYVRHTFVMPATYSDTGKLPLYDLYCDWKFDLF